MISLINDADSFCSAADSFISYKDFDADDDDDERFASE